MRSLFGVGALGTAVAVVGILTACDKEPTRVVGPSAPVEPTVLGVEIDGPSSLLPGQSVQFTAILRLSDGTRQPASGRWHSTSRVLRVDASGLATAGQQAGEDTVSVDVSGSGSQRNASRDILVLPEDTYRLAGTVTETAPPMVPVADARVEVVGRDAVAITERDGRYRLFGVPRGAEIRVTRDGYHPLVQRVQIAGHATQDFRLALSGSRLDLAGPYTLTIDAACSTSTPVPPDLRHRSYAAFLTQTGSTVEVVLTESARFRVNGAGHGDRFSGHADATGATFHLGDNFWPYYGPPYDPSTYPNIVERLSNGSFLVVDGTVLTRGSSGALSGDLRGFFLHYDSRFPNVSPSFSGLGSCYSVSHRFTLTRQ